MKFLYCVYAFNQNYEYIGEQKQLKDSDDSSSEKDGESEEVDEQGNEMRKYKTFTYDYLIKQILENCEDEANQRIKQVADWKLQSTENFLMSMLVNRQDVIAA